jgi:sugar transferase (PEP-CTERM/EpsH1 system associated)
VPYPPFRGDKLKIWNLAKRLSAGNELHLITISENNLDLTYSDELKKHFTQVHLISLLKWKSFLNVVFGVFGKRPLQVSYFKSNVFQTELNGLLNKEKYDAVHVQHIRMARFFEDLSTEKCVLDLPDAFSLYWLRRSENAKSVFMRWFAKMEYGRLLKYEKKMLQKFPINLVCSEEDRQYLKANNKAAIEILPNGVDTEVYYPRGNAPMEAGRILFTGNMDYAPNVDAVEYFVSEIFPSICRVLPKVKFVIAGQRPVAAIKKLASENILVTGFIPNLADEYAKAHIVVAPLRYGAGTQNKVLESMAMGVPVVCTVVGFKGLGIESGQGAICADGRDEFIEKCILLIENEAYRSKIVHSGGDIIRNRFGWNAVADKLQAVFQKLSQTG